MLTHKKNKLLNLLLQFELEINTDKVINLNSKVWETGIYNTIDRNIQSIKKQLKKL